MKKVIYFIAAITLLAFTSVKFDNQKATAIVNQQNGLYVFSDSKPSAEYQYLGSVDTRKVSFPDAQYQYIRDYLLKRAKKDFPDADAVILHLSAGDYDKADVIKFK